VTFATPLLTHLRFHRWATGQVLEETMALPAPDLMKDLKSSFPSVYDTVVHLYQSDSIWLARFEERPTGTRADYEAPGCLYDLRTAWMDVLDRLIAFADGLADSGWEREISYKTLAGVPYRTPIWQMILHVVNHGTHHRGQITTILRQLGATPRNLDLIAYYRANQ
jgi:Uncharacterized protein conserved in bacteria